MRKFCVKELFLTKVLVTKCDKVLCERVAFV